MYELVEEITSSGLTVITSTTTRIFTPSTSQAPALVLTDENGWMESVARDVAQFGHVCLGKRIDAAFNKIVGVDEETIYEAMKLADFTIVEGDGARGLPVKGTADWEPVIPSLSHYVIYVIGLDCLGKPANQSFVHKLQKFLSVTNLQENDLISLASLARLATHSDAGLKNVPASCDYYVALNKSDQITELQAPQNLARMIGSQADDRVKGVILSGLYDANRINVKIEFKNLGHDWK